MGLKAMIGLMSVVMGACCVFQAQGSDSLGGALLINDSPPGASNCGDSYWDLDYAKKIFSKWSQTILSSSGDTPEADLNSEAETSDYNPDCGSGGVPKLTRIQQ